MRTNIAKAYTVKNTVKINTAHTLYFVRRLADT
jgi:hypothetical protein